MSGTHVIVSEQQSSEIQFPDTRFSVAVITPSHNIETKTSKRTPIITQSTQTTEIILG